MDIDEILKKNARIETLMSKIIANLASQSASLANLIDELTSEFAAHSTLTEKILAVKLATRQEDSAIAQCQEDHKEIRFLLDQADRIDSLDSEATAAVYLLRDTLERHLRDEETLLRQAILV